MRCCRDVQNLGRPGAASEARSPRLWAALDHRQSRVRDWPRAQVRLDFERAELAGEQQAATGAGPQLEHERGGGPDRGVEMVDRTVTPGVDDDERARLGVGSQPSLEQSSPARERRPVDPGRRRALAVGAKAVDLGGAERLDRGRAGRATPLLPRAGHPLHPFGAREDQQLLEHQVLGEGPLKPFKDMSAYHQMWQKGRDAKYDMETFDEVLVEHSKGFMDQAKAAGKPFFIWHNTTRMHVFTYLAQKYQAKMNYQSNYGLEEAGMAQMDDDIGDLLKHLDDIGVADNTIVIFTTDNGAEVFTWPDGGMTPFRATKGTVFEGGFRVPCIARWPGKIKPGTVENGIFSGLDWLPTLVAAAGNPSIVQQLLPGVQIGGQTYKNHLDGYNQMDLLTGKGPSARHEIFYFGESQLGAIRIDDFKFQFYQQPLGWPGEKVTTDMPTIVNLRQDPFERTPSTRGQTMNDMGGGYMNDFYAREFWRFVQVQQTVAVAAQSFVEYPPMQQAASFNLAAIKEKIEAMMKSHEGQYPQMHL